MVLKKLNILLLEDDQTFADLLREVIQGMGHNVEVYSCPTLCPVYKNNGARCPKESACADVIISDYMMPEMSGLDFFKLQRARGCKASERNKALMTASTSPDIQQEIEELGCFFLKKPFRIDELKKWLQQCEQRLS